LIGAILIGGRRRPQPVGECSLGDLADRAID
jgi:hypothetical protein